MFKKTNNECSQEVKSMLYGGGGEKVTMRERLSVESLVIRA